MYAWTRALRGDRVLSAEAKEKLFRPYLADYAYGWDVIETERGVLVQHDGGSDLGNSAELRWFVDEDLVIVLFCNQSYAQTPLFEIVRDEIEALAFGGEVDLPPAVVPATPDLFEGIDGGYKLSAGGDLQIQVDGAAATIHPIGQSAVNALFFPTVSQPGVYQDLNLRSNALVVAVVRGDSTVFLGEFQDRARAARVQRFLTDWVHGLEEETGEPPIMANAFGTVPGLEEGSVMTVVKLSNISGGSRLLGFVWRDGALVGFDQIAFSTAMSLAPVSETEFAAYHLGLGRGVPITVVRKDDGSVVGLMVGPAGEARSATKRHKHVHDHEHDEAEHEPGVKAPGHQEPESVGTEGVGHGDEHEGDHEGEGEHGGGHVHGEDCGHDHDHSED
jgi:hypothetical protein